MLILSHLSRRSQSVSQPGPPTGLIPCATPVIHPARPHPVEPSLPPTARSAPFVRTVDAPHTLYPQPAAGHAHPLQSPRLCPQSGWCVLPTAHAPGPYPRS